MDAELRVVNYEQGARPRKVPVIDGQCLTHEVRRWLRTTAWSETRGLSPVLPFQKSTVITRQSSIHAPGPPFFGPLGNGSMLFYLI